ncbi:hypothetical protein AOLI_G00094000 [Acnodon oligacanthus]
MLFFCGTEFHVTPSPQPQGHHDDRFDRRAEGVSRPRTRTQALPAVRRQHYPLHHCDALNWNIVRTIKAELRMEEDSTALLT